MAVATGVNRREPYIGEKRKFLRDGFGTYIYENSFFRYEGEWMKGKKHGHGKLVMKDGTHYEGQFINGEINGNGYKYFASSHAKYTGQFLNGEMHGHGIMTYKNGNVYEGQWYKNKKQGFGILRTSDKAVYEGTFHGHVRDGEGTQTYDGSYQRLSNGDRYEGYWVLDQRAGHGDLWCADGSHYSGNFMNDLFNGAGVMTHASGIVYRGDWINGYPITMASKIVLLEVESPTIIRQGQPFSIKVECRNDEDELVEDQGRELQVIAGFKYRVPKQGSALFDMIEDVEETPIPTPFGYEVVPYPLTDQLGEVSVPTTSEDDSKMSTMVKDDEAEDKPEEEGEEDVATEERPAETTAIDPNIDSDMIAVAHNMAALVTGVDDLATLGEPLEPGAEGENGGADGGSRPESPGDSGAEDIPGVLGVKPEVEVTPLPPPLCSKPTLGGRVEWSNLQLAPPPPMYRPFVIMEEEAGPKKKSKAAQIREKIESEEEQDNEIVSERDEMNKEEENEPDPKSDQSKHDISEQRENQTAPNSSTDIENKIDEGVNLDKYPSKLTVGSAASAGDLASDLERKNSQLPGAMQKSMQEVEKPAVSDEKIARTGEYVLIVQDVTSPPFMGIRLEPAFLMLKLKKPKKIIVKKPNETEPGDSEVTISDDDLSIRD